MQLALRSLPSEKFNDSSCIMSNTSLLSGHDQEVMDNLPRETVSKTCPESVNSAPSQTVENLTQECVNNTPTKTVSNTAPETVDNLTQELKTVDESTPETVDHITLETIDQQAPEMISPDDMQSTAVNSAHEQPSESMQGEPKLVALSELLKACKSKGREVVIVQDSDGNVLIDICVDQSGTDVRRTFFFRVTLANHGALPQVNPDDGWVRKSIFRYSVDPDEFISLTVLVEAKRLRCCPTEASKVRSSNSSWPDMLFESNTHGMMSITAAQLASGEHVSCEWCTTMDDQNNPMDGVPIPGALELINVYEDGEADGGRERFELYTQPTYPSGQPRVTLFPNREHVSHA